MVVFWSGRVVLTNRGNREGVDGGCFVRLGLFWSRSRSRSNLNDGCVELIMGCRLYGIKCSVIMGYSGIYLFQFLFIPYQKINKN